MTEDELIFACSAVSGQISDSKRTVSKAEAVLANLDAKITRQELINKSLRDSLKHMHTQPVVLMAEFRSLRDGLTVSSKALGDLREERHKALLVRNKALAAIPGLQRQLQQLEHQLDTYEPPRTVLEFRRDQ
jgi:chromosome segregation ATPase